MFIEPGQSVIDFSSPFHAGLSQNFPEQLEDLLPGDGPVLDPTDHPLHLLDDRLWPGWAHD